MNDRLISLKTKNINGDLTEIHTLEIINYEITGKYFHAYLKKKYKPKEHYMHYLAQYEYDNDDYYLKNFMDFVKDSTVITFKEK